MSDHEAALCSRCGQPKPLRYFTFRCSECGKHCAVTVKRGHRRLTCSRDCYLARNKRLARAAYGREASRGTRSGGGA